MRPIPHALPALGLVLTFSLLAPAAEPWRVLEPGQRPGDARLGPPRTLNDAYHPWSPPTAREDWEREAQAIRERILVSNGLWPLPPKTPLEPTIHGAIDRGDYTIEKVYFASLPGHYVTGNLYRPKQLDGQAPGVLSPHGHWPNGRLYDAGEDRARQEVEAGAEQHLAGARYPLQARMAQLARMGCIVFHYDMIGYADSTAIPHRAGFTEVDAGLRLQNEMGLQTWNSIRALDFLLSLPDVDPERIGVTGASGGGTQTFLLGAIDPRPAAAFPAVMVSTAMQGGCTCENADYLRIGINNIALTAPFAPRPLAMSGADDWTIEIETKGLPELRQVYALFDREPLVTARTWPEFGHNYNQVAREMMYNWFNEHLGLGQDSPVVERDFEPVPPEQLRVFDEAHPRPADEKPAEALRRQLAETADEQFAALLPQDQGGVDEYRRIVGTAARVMLDPGVAAADEVTVDGRQQSRLGDVTLTKGLLSRRGAGEAIPFVVLTPADFQRTVVLWVDGAGSRHLFDDEGRPAAAVARLLEQGMAVASIDAFLTGVFVEGADPPAPHPVDERYHGYTFGYNRPLLSNRVRDILTVIGSLSDFPGPVAIHLVGTGEAGPWALLAAGLAGERVDRTLADLQGFGFRRITEVGDPHFLPGALKYGGVGGLAALAAPQPLAVYGTRGAPPEELQPLRAVFEAAGGDLALEEGPLTAERVVEQLVN